MVEVVMIWLMTTTALASLDTLAKIALKARMTFLSINNTYSNKVLNRVTIPNKWRMEEFRLHIKTESLDNAILELWLA